MADLKIYKTLPLQDEKHEATILVDEKVASFEEQENPGEFSPPRLLKQLTLEEKVGLLSGSNFVATAGNARIGLAPLKVCF